MTESPKAAATTRARQRLTWKVRVRRLLIWLPALVLIASGVAVSAGMFASPVEDAPPVRELGLGWKTIDIQRSSTGNGYSITASVDGGDRLDGARATSDSDYVLWMLGNGDYDDVPWTDSWGDEQALGMTHDEQLTIVPIRDGEARKHLIRSGHYTPSVDGVISYDRIPPGQYELRALVVRDGGVWDGTIATRRIEVS
jgi:hypothetical protein